MSFHLSFYNRAIFIASASVFLFFSTAQAASVNSVMQRLEAGQIVSTKAGSSVTVQTLISADPAKATALFQDVSMLPELFKEIAFVQVYTTSDKKNLVYMKLKGLGDGVGVLAEVKAGSDRAFTNATDLVVSSRAFGLRDSATEVDLAGDNNSLPNQLMKEVEVKNAEKNVEEIRNFQIVQSLVLEGPLNTVEQLPTNRFTIAFGVGPYSILPGADAAAKKVQPKNFSYVVAKVSVGNQVHYVEFFDIAGFGDRKLMATMGMAEDMLRGLKGSLAKL